MIFKQAQQVLDGTKRQTRRLVKKGDMASHDEKGNIVAVYREVKDWDFKTKAWRKRLLWKVGKDLAVQPGRGKKSLGRTDPLKAIRRERLREISPEDIFAEMAIPKEKHTPRGVAIALLDFMKLWNSLHRKPYLWENDPEAWVLVW